MQVTYCVSGRLEVRMRELSLKSHYDLQIGPGEAVITRPATFLQLRIYFKKDAKVLYIVSPTYAFEKRGAKMIYDDAVIVAKSGRTSMRQTTRGRSFEWRRSTGERRCEDWRR